MWWIEDGPIGLRQDYKYFPLTRFSFSFYTFVLLIKLKISQHREIRKQEREFNVEIINREVVFHLEAWRLRSVSRISISELPSISKISDKTRKNINFGANVSAGRQKKISKVSAEIASRAKLEFKYRVVWPSDIWQIVSTPLQESNFPYVGENIRNLRFTRFKWTSIALYFPAL